MKKVYIVQHCQSEHHVNELTGGWTDTPLTELGNKQAIKVAKELKALGLTEFTLYSSDLKRAYMTAEAISKEFGKDIIKVKELREINNGEAKNKTKSWAKENQLFQSNILEVDKPSWNDAETPRELHTRMKNIIKDYILPSEEDIVIVSHGIAIAYLVGSWVGLKAEDMQKSFIKGWAGGISTIEISPINQNQITHFNLVSHLRGLK